MTEGEAMAPVVLIEPSRGWAALGLREVWAYRELLFFLVWRDLKVRYRQTALGVLWVVLQPVLSMVVFSLLFGGLLKVPSGGVPYPIFAYAALLPWNYFAASFNRSSASLVGSAHLITKVYFPRLVIPISGVLSGLVDFAVAFIVLIGMMAFYSITPTPAVVLLPAFILLAMVTALGFGLWLSALNVRYRDINYLIPYLVQVGMYLTPVIYGSSLIPERFRFLLALNPMTGVVEGFRWALLGNHLADAQPPGALFPVSIGIALAILVSGAIFFRRTERTFADII
ncbi:MAG TPA: ABC transporter permease [Anaerolineae bacterium]|nr:ABC transporter permease [Anaerolineae bacterium]HQK13187.1 ABC transporter permease [Anaerolineae bacterium]